MKLILGAALRSLTHSQPKLYLGAVVKAGRKQNCASLPRGCASWVGVGRLCIPCQRVESRTCKRYVCAAKGLSLSTIPFICVLHRCFKGVLSCFPYTPTFTSSSAVYYSHSHQPHYYTNNGAQQLTPQLLSYNQSPYHHPKAFKFLRSQLLQPVLHPPHCPPYCFHFCGRLLHHQLWPRMHSEKSPPQSP